LGVRAADRITRICCVDGPLVPMAEGGIAKELFMRVGK
jgi:hypothetical protein